MDHYPPLIRPVNVVEVPYLDGVYDNGDFANYPTRRGINVQALLNGDLQHNSHNQILEFLQTWFFFGMIRDFVEVDITATDFVKTDENGKKFLTTKRLPVYLGEWRVRIEKEQKSTDENAMLQLMQQRERRLESFFMTSFNHWKSFRPVDADSLLDPPMRLCLQLLGSLLEFTVSHLDFIDLDRDHTPWRCPTTCENLYFPADLALQYYASLLDPPGSSIANPQPRGHRTCLYNHKSCQAENIDPVTYKTLHTEPSCNCTFVAVDQDVVRSIILGAKADEHGIPLVCWTPGEDITGLEVVPFEPGMKYTVLSHVYGNNFRCVVIILIPSAGPTKPIGWPPVARTNTKIVVKSATFGSHHSAERNKTEDGRKTAIRSMREIYTRARTTLILDAYLCQGTGYARYEEKFTRITVAGWQRRMWTLQEAILSRRSYVQWSDMSELIHPIGDLQLGWKQRDVWSCYHNNVGCAKFNFATSAMVGIERPALIYNMFHQMKLRSTSKPIDEAVILATLLALPASTIRLLQDIPDLEGRLQAMWTALLDPGIPSAVLFLAGNKLSRPGFRWAPKSLTDCGFASMPNDFRHVVTPRITDSMFVGVSLEQPGLLVDTPPKRPTSLITCRLEGDIYYIRRSKLIEDDWKDLDLSKIPRLGLLLAQNPSMHASGRQNLVAAVAALVAVEGEDGSELRAQWLRQVSIFKAGSRFDIAVDPPWRPEEIEEKTRVVEASYLSVRQPWCIT
ncbi:hypothetical protein FH972_026257 [Carpinus fangiana]|uniref:Heterokaryon incompatibility domain-containing protein n=1 Tax=Carpinus fangiana TaxID=176857 RepID=A0A5N6L3T7_9ROSI|nr:hypothetical protein FH972_026257 [Carpinus fangiana]